jgi:imidazolonepropionase-like amidohydrolase
MATLTVLRHARLLDCTGAPPRENSTVVVEDDRIAEVTDAAAFHPPAGATVVDCRGHTLMPGLTDAHVHVTGVDANVVELHRNLPPSLIALKAGVVLADMLRRPPPKI